MIEGLSGIGKHFKTSAKYKNIIQKSSKTKHFKALLLAQKEGFELPSHKNRLVNVVKYRQIWLRNKHFALKSFDVI